MQLKRRITLIVVSCLLVSMLGACVTTTNAPAVDIESAHDKRITLGHRYLDNGDRDKARWQFSKALEYVKNSGVAYQGIAMVHQANGEMEPAGENFEKALRYVNKEHEAGVFISYGQYLVEMQQTEDACEYFEKAAADYDFDGRPEALYLAGKCAQKIGNPKRGVAAFEHAVNLDPNFTPALLDLAEIYFERAEYAKAKQFLDRFERTTKGTARSIWLGIRIERIFGNKDKEASYALALKNLYPYSKEYLAYRQLQDQMKQQK